MHPLHRIKKGKKRTGYAKALHILVYIASFAGPAMTLPQLYTVWIEKSVQGVSVATWAGFAIVASIWVAYGLSEKDIPIIISNTLWVIVQTSVVIGVLVFR